MLIRLAVVSEPGFQAALLVLLVTFNLTHVPPPLFTYFNLLGFMLHHAACCGFEPPTLHGYIGHSEGSSPPLLTSHPCPLYSTTKLIPPMGVPVLHASRAGEGPRGPRGPLGSRLLACWGLGHGQLGVQQPEFGQDAQQDGPLAVLRAGAAAAVAPPGRGHSCSQNKAVVNGWEGMSCTVCMSLSWGPESRVFGRVGV